MNNNNSNTLDPLNVPLSGTRLIEASAGTGKTYNIANLYLRLLLGHSLERRYTIEEILVVTFTRAATAELSNRIRGRIDEALMVLRGKPTDDRFLEQLFSTMDELDKRKASQSLNLALLSMDNASIFTIHGFANRALQRFPFESGALTGFEVTLGENSSAKQVLLDAWRSLESHGLGTLRKHFSKKENFESYFNSDAVLDTELIRPGPLAKSKAIKQREEDLANLRVQRNPLYFQICEAILTKPELVEEDRFRAVFPKGQTARFMVAFFNGHFLTSQSAAAAKSAGYIDELIAFDREDSAIDDQELCSFLEDLSSFYRLSLDIKKRQDELVALVLENAFELLKVKFDKRNPTVLSPDDTVRELLQQINKSEQGGAIRDALVNAYPACLVDEFQDTDSDQFRLLSTVYEDGSDSSPNAPCLFMIGDPKQSIYAFRGADIFAYLRVRQELAKKAGTGERPIYSLETNWRSSSRLVEAVNGLFKGHSDALKPPFVYSGIDYHRVKPKLETEGKDVGELLPPEDKTGGTACIQFVYETDSPKADEGRARFATDTASRIAKMLTQSWRIHCEDTNTERPLRENDFAILVNNRTEAAAVKRALAEIGLKSVYLAGKESVFQSSEIARDLLEVLIAFQNPANQGNIKRAISTPLLSGFEAGISQLDSFDQRGERWMEIFAHCNELWTKASLLSAFRYLDTTEGITQRLVKLPYAERILTDYRHLMDLLQRKDLEFSSMEQVIDWYRATLKDDSSVDEDSRKVRLESDDELIRIATIHGSKGLEYNVVFIPFSPTFKSPKKDSLPAYHDPAREYQRVVNFREGADPAKVQLIEESRAESVRLLYVAITRAKYFCSIGLTAGNAIKSTAWHHLLGLEKNKKPGWEEIHARLRENLEDNDTSYQPIDYQQTDDARRASCQDDSGSEEKLSLPQVEMPVSRWQITSFSRLAHSGGSTPGIQWGQKADDDGSDTEAADQADAETSGDRFDLPQFALHGSATTGDCLHEIFEDYAADPEEKNFKELVAHKLAAYKLAEPPRRWRPKTKEDDLKAQWQEGLVNWLSQVLQAPLDESMAAVTNPATLQSLFANGQTIPELVFDFSLASASAPLTKDALKQALKDTKLKDWSPKTSDVHGLMTGAIDLTFVHDNRVYILDYKSNTLGSHPGAYNQAGMDKCMNDNHYHLQYLIYTTALHRYLAHRYRDRYQYDGEDISKLSFGGVFYLFLRGMGVDDNKSYGVWFRRPALEHIKALDTAFSQPGEAAA